MFCIKVDNIPQELCDMDDELKAIYHSKDTFCVWTFKTKDERNEFVDKTAGMNKADREEFYYQNYNNE